LGFRCSFGPCLAESISQLQRLGNRLAIESAVLANLQGSASVARDGQDQEIAAATAIARASGIESL